MIDSTPDFRARRQKLLDILRESDVDVMLVSSEPNVRYLTGFTGDSSALLIGPDFETMVSDSRYTTQLAEECPGLEVYVRPTQQRLAEAIARTIRSRQVSSLGIEGHIVSVDFHSHLANELPRLDLVNISGRIESDLRSIKDEFEIDQTRQAVALAEEAFEGLRGWLKPDVTEREVAWELERRIRAAGGEGMSFPPIVAVGDRAALPHYRPQVHRISEAGLLLVDWGAQAWSGYKSDLTRTLFTRQPSDEFVRIYETVLEAQQRAIALMRPGVDCRTVDAAARDFIAESGYGDCFGHGLGHGIGLEIHEQPRLSPSSETVLTPGMIVTVEPGIYLPGKGGVRIEDDVLVREDGCEVLSSTPRDLEAMLVSE